MPQRLPITVPEDATLRAAVDDIVARHGTMRGQLLPILQDLLVDRGMITDEAVQLVADRLGIAPTEVQGVVTFYAFLDGTRRGRHVIRLCRTLSCAMAGTRAVGAALEKELGIPFGGTTPDGLVTLEWASCIGMCSTPPALLADAEAVGSVSPADVRDVIRALRAADAVG